MIKLALILVFLTSPALAKDLTVTLNDDDQATIAQALDAYVKTGGLSIAPRAVGLLQKLQAALAKPDAPSVLPPASPPK